MGAMMKTYKYRVETKINDPNGIITLFVHIQAESGLRAAQVASDIGMKHKMLLVGPI